MKKQKRYSIRSRNLSSRIKYIIHWRFNGSESELREAAMTRRLKLYKNMGPKSITDVENFYNLELTYSKKRCPHCKRVTYKKN